MQAMVVTDFGETEVFHSRDNEEPTPRPDQIAIDVAFAAVNLADTKIRRGEHYRAPEPPFILGREVSGRVRSWGEQARGFSSDDPVTARLSGGGYAAVAIAKAHTRVGGLDINLCSQDRSSVCKDVLTRYVVRFHHTDAQKGRSPCRKPV